MRRKELHDIIDREFDNFIEFRGDRKAYVTVASCKLFAEHVVGCIQTRPAVPDSLTAWLEREMPSGTVIGDPKWWASRIAKALLANQQPEGE